MESMQASLEAESKGKIDAMKVKKKLEQDINELEIALDAANRGKAELEKNIKKFQQQVRVSVQNLIQYAPQLPLFEDYRWSNMYCTWGIIESLPHNCFIPL